MPRIYKIEKEGGETSQFADPGSAAAALRALGADDYRRFSEDVKELSELKSGDSLCPTAGVTLTVEEVDDEGNPVEAQQEEPKDEKQIAEEKAKQAEESAKRPTSTKPEAPAPAVAPSVQQAGAQPVQKK